MKGEPFKMKSNNLRKDNLLAGAAVLTYVEEINVDISRKN